MQLLPLDRFHPDFVRIIDAMIRLLPHAAESAGSVWFLAQHLVDMGFLPTLLELLLDPVPSLLSSDRRIHYILGISTPPSGAHGPADPCADADALQAVAALIRQVLKLDARSNMLATAERRQGGGDHVVATVEQLLSSPAALAALVHRALSAEAQEAARAGRDTAAARCMASVCGVFRFAAFLLHVGTNSGGSDLEGARRKLGAFLVLEDNLPILEQLCVPLDPNSTCRIACCLTLCHAQSCSARRGCRGV
jgi:hypothetical protein